MKKTSINLIPETVNPSPDYYCTWQTQLYATSDGKPPRQREIIDENSLFSHEKPYGWAYFYEKARSDLLFVMDDSWDVPKDGDSSYYGSLVLNSEKFPDACKATTENAEALQKLVERMKALGWKGLGGWVCAQESARFLGDSAPKDYWTKRLYDAQRAGFSYWKVDWGEKAGCVDFRNMLTDVAREIAPHLTVEHAMVKEMIPHGDVFRTYDVPALLSIPMTMQKLADILVDTPRGDGAGLINCEDEVYAAAAGGFTMGVMRHPYVGNLPDGRPDMSFPAVHRNLKSKMTEVLRAVRWHRIAPAFAVDSTQVTISKYTLSDSWSFRDSSAEIEAWWLNMPILKDSRVGDTVTLCAPAQIARGCKLANVAPDENLLTPYVICSKNPNGAFSIVTLGRTLGHEYRLPACDVIAYPDNADTIGIFGAYRSLTLIGANAHNKRLLLQDLADECAYDITDEIQLLENGFTLSGELIDKITRTVTPNGDTSESGLALKLVHA